MTNRKFAFIGWTWGLTLALLFMTALPALAQKSDRAKVFKYADAQRLRPDDGYMVAGEIWDTIKPMNSSEREVGNGVEDPLRGEQALHWITIGPDGSNWHDPGCFWPGGYHIVNCWRDGRRMFFPVFEADGWPAYTAGNRVRDADGTADERFMFAYYTPQLQGAGDPARDYKDEAYFTDETRTHMVYEAGWPTTAGIDFKIRGHQYSINEQNLNDFTALEITMTNTGVVDTDGDGNPEETDHVIDAVAAQAWGLPTIAVRVLQTGVRNANVFGQGRTMGYFATPRNGEPLDALLWYSNVPPNRSAGRTVPAAGTRLFGVNNGRFREGYIDQWNGWRFAAAKQGSIDDGLSGASPDKLTLFGTHGIGEGERRGWYGSTLWEASLNNRNASDKAFRMATATWYEDYGKNTNQDTKLLGPNPAFFSGGTADDVTTFVVGNPDARPNGDYKYASVDLGPAAIEQPVWEPLLNPGAADGSDFYGGVGWNLEYVFSQDLVSGNGPYSLEVGESMTLLFVMAAGYRAEGLFDAFDAAEWAFDRSWDIDAELPVPPAPDVLLVSTTNGTAKINWTDVSTIDGDIDGYKIWKASQFKKTNYLDNGFRALDRYHQLHDVGGSIEPFLDDVNPWFDAQAEFVSETQGVYQPAEWGTYDLVLKIPIGEVSQYQGGAEPGYQFAWEDLDTITGFTYWYYVSAYKEGSYSGPQGAVPVGHIESSNFNRNGRNSPNAAPGEIGLISPWGGTYPFADRNADFPTLGTEQNQNIGYKFTVTPPVAPASAVADLITVSPNPYKVAGLNDVRNNPADHNIDFLNLPGRYTLTIVDVSGQIVLEHSEEAGVNGKFTWDLFSKDGTEVSSGLYIYHLEYDGGEVTGHIAILR